MKANTKIRDFSRDVIKIKVSFSAFDGTMASEKVAQVAAAAEHADQNRIKGKVVAIKRESLKATFAAMNAMKRLWKYGDGDALSGTRPWEDGGWRLAFATEYATLRQKLEALARNYADAVQTEIGKAYKELKAQAEKELNGLIGDRFPTLETLLAKYEVRILTDRLASMDDMRFSGLSEQEAQAIAQEREKYYLEQIDRTNEEMISELTKAVSDLHERLSKADSNFQGTPETGFPILENVIRMADRIEKFNLSGSQKVTDAISKLRKAISEIDLQTAKEDPKARKQAATKAKSILDDLLSF